MNGRNLASSNVYAAGDSAFTSLSAAGASAGLLQAIRTAVMVNESSNVLGIFTGHGSTGMEVWENFQYRDWQRRSAKTSTP